MGRTRYVALLVAVVVAGACSSSSDSARKTTSRAGTGTGSDAAAPGALSETAAATDSPAAATEPAGEANSKRGTSPSQGAAGSGSSPAAGGTAGATKAPKLGGTIKVGAVTVDYAGIQDVKGYNTGSPGAQAKAVVDYLNGQGGIAGRKIELVTAKFPATTNNIAAEEQQMCASFTEDHKVFAVIYGLVTEGRAFVPCLARRDVPLINSGGGGLADERFMAQYPRGYFMPGSMNLSRLARSYIDGLIDQGFFGAGSKIGLVRVDDEPFKRAADQIVKPRLAARGLKLDAEAVVAAQTSLGRSAAQMPNIVLRFQQSGINRVLFLDNAMVAALFAIQASSQGYNPRYGLNSLALPNTLDNNLPPGALRGAVGVGWQAGLDVAAENDDSPKNAAVDTCTAIMNKAGLSGVDRTGQWQQRLYCDELFFLRDALKGVADITPGALATRVTALGTSYQSALTRATKFFAGRRDGTAQVRFFAFNDACSCFRYTSPPRAVG